MKLPSIGIGTFEASPGETRQCEAAVLAALEAGYRLIDTASLYGSEIAVGSAIRKSCLKREDITVCTKFWNHCHRPEDVKWSFDQSIDRLGLDYVDVFMMHWPLAFERTDRYEEAHGPDGKVIVNYELSTNHEPTWRAMESLVDSGKVKSIGVSNFTIPQLERLLSYARIKPVCNQVEAHPWLPQHDLFDFCQKHDIAFMAYSPLGSQSGPVAMHAIEKNLMEDETVKTAASRLGVGAAQVLLGWAVQRGSIPIPKSATPHRIISNFQVPTLPDHVFQELDSITIRDPLMKKRLVNFDLIWNTKQFPDGT